MPGLVDIDDNLVGLFAQPEARAPVVFSVWMRQVREVLVFSFCSA
jgi:hypothetical protein